LTRLSGDGRGGGRGDGSWQCRSRCKADWNVWREVFWMMWRNGREEALWKQGTRRFIHFGVVDERNDVCLQRASKGSSLASLGKDGVDVSASRQCSPNLRSPSRTIVIIGLKSTHMYGVKRLCGPLHRWHRIASLICRRGRSSSCSCSSKHTQRNPTAS